MRKSKIMKALLVFGMSVVTATAMVGFAACDKPDTSKDNDSTNNKTDDTTPAAHEHKWSAWTYVNDETHKRECTADGHDGNKTETASHGTLDADNKCPDCHHQFTQQGDDEELVDPVQWRVTSGATDTYADGETITDNGLFTLKTSGAGYHTGDPAKSTLATMKIEEAGISSLTSAIMSEATKTETNDSGDILVGEWVDDVYTIVAKHNATVTVYLNVVNKSYNSQRPDIPITVTSSAGAYFAEKSVNREGGVALTLDVIKGTTYKIGVANTSSLTGRLWLYGIDAEQDTSSTVKVNYKHGETLIGNTLLPDGGTIAAPAAPIRKDAKFLGWYDAATGGTEYTFGALEAGVKSVDVYAQYKESDVTVNFYDKDGTTLISSVKSFSGDKVAKPADPTDAGGADFLGWYTEADELYDFNTVLVADTTVNLHAKFDEVIPGTVVTTIYLSDPTSLTTSTAAGTVIAGTGVVSGISVATSVKDGAESNDVLATIKLAAAVGAIKNTTLTINGVTSKHQIQTGIDNGGDILTIDLASGYTYKISIWARTNTKDTAAKFTLDSKDERLTGTGNGNGDFVEIVWNSVASGTHTVQQSIKKSVISHFVITAVPVANS